MFNSERIDKLEERIRELEREVAFTRKVAGVSHLGIPFYGKDIGVSQALHLLFKHFGLTIERKDDVVVSKAKK